VKAGFKFVPLLCSVILPHLPEASSAPTVLKRKQPNGKPLSPPKVVALDPNHKNFAHAVGADGLATIETA
jgi:hypothetical protein